MDSRARRVKRLDLKPIAAKPRATMQRLTLDQPIPDALRGAIVALGNFDGFHLGHQAVVGRAVQRGAHERRPVIVATFDPHPVRHFRPDTPPFRLTTLDQRERMFAAAGADAMLVFSFDAELAATTAEDFVGELLAEQIGAAGVVTGEDFTFGKGRGGNADGAARARRGARHRRRDGRAGRCSTASASRRAGSARRSRPATPAPRRAC